jgi:hypothetical protein
MKKYDYIIMASGTSSGIPSGTSSGIPHGVTHHNMDIFSEKRNKFDDEDIYETTVDTSTIRMGLD